MMKKKFFVFSMLMFMVLALVSCKNHTHQASEEWKTDATSHWHICSGCDELLDIAVHTFDDWQVSVQATVSQVGSEKRTCTVCGYEETREIPKVSHEHSYATTYSSNSTHHWFACECGEKKDEAVHIGGTATTESLAVCEVCGKEYGNLLPQPSHVCSYVEGVCSCGKTEPGAFDKTIDGSFDDWSEEDKANALTTFGESGTGFSVMGYYKDDKAYFATTISTAVVDPHSFEIFQKDGQTRYMVKYSGNGGSWTPTEGAEHLIGLSVTQEKDDKGNNVYYVETLWDFSEFPREANGNYKINFSVVLYFPELSAASYSDVQQDYWVLYGVNAWDRSWHFELTDTTKFTHSHVYNKNFECVICGADNKLADSEIDLDGKIDDWNEDILDKMLVSYDEEDRWFKLAGYTDEKYLYLYLSLAHREAVGAVNIVILGDDGWIEYGQIKYGDSISLRGIDAAHVIEYKDDETSFIVTDYEFAISLDKIRTVASRAVTDKGVQLGIDIFNESDEQSYGFAIDNKLNMWGIAGLSSWNVNQHFIYGNNGVDHQHTWDEETLKCKLCPADMPEVEGDIVVDGDLSDWSAEIKATTSKTYGESGTGWEIMGYREGTIVYFGVTIKTAGAVPALFSFVERGSLGFTDHQIRYENGEWKKTAGVLYIGSSFEDGDIIDTYVLEVVCDLSELEAYEDGDYLFGLNVNVPGEASAATFEAAKPDYWVMFGRNAWESDDKMFRVTENGITHNHILSSTYEFDNEYHWKQCQCGYLDKAEHSGGTATEDKLPICEVCNQLYGELADHTHNYELAYDETHHWTECSCGLKTTIEKHSGGTATETEKAICEVCEQPYGGTLNYMINVDGDASDWSEEVKANVLKGWYEDADGKTRGLEYMAFVDENYVYLYTRSITASNADKGFDIIFNKNGVRPATSLWLNAPGENIVEYYFSPNVALENGLYETVSEIVLDKSAYVNSNGKVFLGIWFIGCDDSFSPLSWHETGKTTIWGLNHRCPWNLTMSHQQVTENGFDHYHDLDANNVCGWCQETIELGITVDGNKDDWSEEILSTALTSTGKNNIYAAAYLDDEFAYFYVEITQLGSQEPNYFRIFAKDSQKDGIRSSEEFPLYFDAGTTNVRPWCLGSWACAHYNDCDNGYTKYALSKTTNADGQTVFAYELVIDRDLICKPNGDVQVQIAIDDINVWASGQTVADWGNMPYVTENGFSN